MRNKVGDKARLLHIKARLLHIVEAISEIQLYIENTHLKDFTKNSMKKFATVKQLEIIGEAANYISEDLKAKHAYIEWGEIIGLRNILIHQYFGIDENILWEIVTNDIPKLKKQFLRILNEKDL